MSTGTVLATTLVLGSFYVLLGLSWVVIFRATQVLNLAIGQQMALAAYIFYELYTHGLPFALALALTLLISAVLVAIGFLIVVRPVQSQPHFVTAVACIGYSWILAGLIAIIWGIDTRFVPLPLPNHVYVLPDNARFTTYGLATVVAALAYAGSVALFFKKTSIGIKTRAASEAPLLASQSGINITLVFVLAWGIAGIAAALAGISFSYTNILTPTLATIGLRGLVPALIGGFESITGTVAGAYLLAFIETVGVTVLGGNAEDAVVGVVILAFLLLRPTGVSGQARVRRV